MSSHFRKAKEHNALDVFGDGRKRNKSKKIVREKTPRCRQDKDGKMYCRGIERFTKHRWKHTGGWFRVYRYVARSVGPWADKHGKRKKKHPKQQRTSINPFARVFVFTRVYPRVFGANRPYDLECGRCTGLWIQILCIRQNTIWCKKKKNDNFTVTVPRSGVCRQHRNEKKTFTANERRTYDGIYRLKTSCFKRHAVSPSGGLLGLVRKRNRIKIPSPFFFPFDKNFSHKPVVSSTPLSSACYCYRLSLRAKSFRRRREAFVRRRQVFGRHVRRRYDCVRVSHIYTARRFTLYFMSLDTRR